MPYLELPGIDLWYTDTGGDGIPVIFLHAASGNTDCWVYQEPVFTSAGYRCIAYDRRGWGRSRLNQSGPQPGYTSDDLHDLVDHLGLDRFHLVATAAGGIGSLDYSLLHPERVRCLVAANTIGGVQDPAYLEVQHRLRPKEIQDLPVELRELGPSYRGINPEGAARWLEIDHHSRQEETTGPQPLRDTMTYARLETMQIPVLMIAGDADLLSPPAMMRLLANHIPGCEWATVPAAGHAAFWEEPEVWNSIVLEFINRH
tara:strand:- start:370 stop:1143 length:774 start_codon:yes stop_codon:yes gene_type:complete